MMHFGLLGLHIEPLLDFLLLGLFMEEHAICEYKLKIKLFGPLRNVISMTNYLYYKEPSNLMNLMNGDIMLTKIWSILKCVKSFGTIDILNPPRIFSLVIKFYYLILV